MPRVTVGRGSAVVTMALLALSVFAACGERRPRGVSSFSGPPPKLHTVVNSPDGVWQLAVVERHPTDPDLHGTTWQVFLAPVGQMPDSGHCSFDAQDLVPEVSWLGNDSVLVLVRGASEKLADIPPSYHTTETVLGRDGQRHSIPFRVTVTH